MQVEDNNQQVQGEDTSTETQNQDDAQITAQDDKRLSQSEVDDIVAKRLARERKKLKSELQAEAEEKAKRERMDETERLKLEREEADTKAANAQKQADARVIRSEAKAQAAMLGIKPERVKYALRLADLEGVDVDEDGEPDEDAIKAALTQVVEDLPELVATEPEQEERQIRRSPDASRKSGALDESSQSFNDILRARGLSSGVS